MDCLTCREALSSRIDGEDEPVPAEQTDRHLASCTACRAWQARAIDLSRTLRVRPATAVPDLSVAILADAAPPQPSRGWWARIALIAVAAAQIGLAFAQMFGVGAPAGHGGHHGPGLAAAHLFNESTAWNLALGIGLLWAAFRARATSGLIPVLSGFVVLIGAYSAYDLVMRTVTVSRVAGHGLLLVGLALLVVINRRYGDQDPRSDGMPVSGNHVHADDAGTMDPADSTGTGPRRGPLRPAGRHRAA